MTNIDNLLGIAQQFSTASATIKTAGRLVSILDDTAARLEAEHVVKTGQLG